MNRILSRHPLVVAMVVIGLLGATALVAGFTQGSGQAAATTSDSTASVAAQADVRACQGTCGGEDCDACTGDCAKGACAQAHVPSGCASTGCAQMTH